MLFAAECRNPNVSAVMAVEFTSRFPTYSGSRTHLPALQAFYQEVRAAANPRIRVLGSEQDETSESLIVGDEQLPMTGSVDALLGRFYMEVAGRGTATALLLLRDASRPYWDRAFGLVGEEEGYALYDVRAGKLYMFTMAEESAMAAYLERQRPRGGVYTAYFPSSVSAPAPAGRAQKQEPKVAPVAASVPAPQGRAQTQEAASEEEDSEPKKVAKKVVAASAATTAPRKRAAPTPTPTTAPQPEVKKVATPATAGVAPASVPE